MEISGNFSNNRFNPLEDNPATLPNKGGAYLICIKNTSTLPDLMQTLEFSKIEDMNILYVGISGTQGLKKRDYKNHFRGTARSSTLRKSLGVLFGYERHFYNDGRYRFSDRHEEELSLWMKNNLILFYYLDDNMLEVIENLLIKAFSPPLNLMGNHSLINLEFRNRLSILRNQD